MHIAYLYTFKAAWYIFPLKFINNTILLFINS